MSCGQHISLMPCLIYSVLFTDVHSPVSTSLELWNKHLGTRLKTGIEIGQMHEPINNKMSERRRYTLEKSKEMLCIRRSWNVHV
jgi:hypothetical protein